MQIADVYIASRTLDLAADDAAWRLAEGLRPRPTTSRSRRTGSADRGAGRAAAPATTCTAAWASTMTYPLHRYFSWVTDIARALGGAEPTLAAVPVDRDRRQEPRADRRAAGVQGTSCATTSPAWSADDDRARDAHRPARRRPTTAIIKQMGADGWMGVGWPKEYGGHGLGEIEQQIFANEAARADVHLPAVTLQTVGPTLIRRTAPRSRRTCSSPTSSPATCTSRSATASPTPAPTWPRCAPRARRDGDHYVVNGQKMWTTGGHEADYVWLAVRTDPDAPKHKGISMLIVDTNDPGYSWTPIITADGSHHANATYYNDVRVPVDMLVGEENQGWRLITTQLNHERVMLGPAGRHRGAARPGRRLGRPHGRRASTEPDVRDAARRRRPRSFRVNELLNWEVAARPPRPARSRSPTRRRPRCSPPTQVQALGRRWRDVVHRVRRPGRPGDRRR